MNFSVAKCHSMRVTRRQHHKQILFDSSLHNTILETVQSVQYLGILTITDNMEWDQRISQCFTKVTKTDGSFAGNRLLHLRVVAYKALVQPKLD